MVPAPGGGRRHGTRGWLGAMVLASLPCIAAAAPGWRCLAPLGEVSALVERQRWLEHDERGHRLVRERGSMPVAATALATRCGDVEATLELGHAQGTRRYDGTASTGAALQTESAIRDERLAATARLPWAPGWSWGLRLSHERSTRDIADAGQVRGYPERFRLWQLAAGVRRTLPVGVDRQMSAEGWWGVGRGSLDLSLPFADPARLTLGSHRQWRLDLRLGPRDGATVGPGWQLHWLASLADRRLSAGPVQALTRDGRLVGGAAQPRSALTTLQAGAALRHPF